MISIVVPTYKEAANIPVLTQKINEAMKKAKLQYEIIVVDDNSNDGIADAVSALAKKKYPIRLEIRINERGLSSAVIKGFRLAKGDIIVVMDADLSHPPEKIPELVSQIINHGAEFAVGSRFVKGGSAAHFNWYRQLNAWISKTLARPLTKVTDPMAGFFCFTRKILTDIEILNPIGFKIGLEVIVKTSPKKILEIPIEFKERLHGESKLSMKEQINYLIHLERLMEYKYKTAVEFIKFSLIGGVGMVIDLTSVHISYGILAVPFRISRVIGFMLAVTSNFLLNRKFTFTHAQAGDVRSQYIKFLITAVVAFVVNWFISVYLFENFELFNRLYLLAAFVGIIGGLVINFVGSKFIVFKTARRDVKSA